MPAKVLIIGGGGREHALGWKLAQSQDISTVYYSPGNAGTALEPKSVNIDFDATIHANFPDLATFVLSKNIDIVVVGPEAPLANGLVDYMQTQWGYNRVFGPNQSASLLESDKFFSYDLMNEVEVPQASSIKCTSLEETISAIEKISTERGVVLKARGLTGGKGVAVYDSKEDALSGATSHIQKFGPELLVAERLFGQEYSIFAFSDGSNVSVLPSAFQDHKRLLDNDKGPNTGGMGAYGPFRFANSEKMAYITNKMLTPLVQRMNEDGNPFVGFLYAGVMETDECPKILEFNIRFGDPECQPVMMLLDFDLYHAISLTLEGKAYQINPLMKNGASCCVVLASKGYPDYPDEYKKQLEIYGLDAHGSEVQNNLVKVFHAGTKKKNGKVVTAGGRVLGVTSYSEPQNSYSETLQSAINNAYERIKDISVDAGFHYRTDIGIKGF